MKPRDLLNRPRTPSEAENKPENKQLAHYVEVHKAALAAERRAQARAKGDG